MLDADLDQQFWYAIKYWFYGLGLIILLGPILAVALPFQAEIIRNLPADWVMPGLPTVNPVDALNPLAYANLMVYRLLMPYNYFMECLGYTSHYNLRYISQNEAANTLWADWILLPFWWYQAVVMFFLTLPAWPFVVEIV